MFSKKQIDQMTLEKILKYGQEGEFEYDHHFYGDIYIREMKAKKNSLILGGLHLKDFPIILLTGKVLKFENQDKELWIAPHYSQSCIGHYRIFYGLEDYTLISIHYTKLRDIALIEKENCASELFQKGKLIKELIYEHGDQCNSNCSIVRSYCRNGRRLGNGFNNQLYASQSNEESGKES